MQLGQYYYHRLYRPFRYFSILNLWMVQHNLAGGGGAVVQRGGEPERGVWDGGVALVFHEGVAQGGVGFGGSPSI